MDAQTIWLHLYDTPFRLDYAVAAGVKTRYLEAGEGPPLLLLHGTGGHLEAYARNIRGLSQRFRVIAYDMVGHGFSDKPDRPYTVDFYVEHLLSLMDTLGLSKAHLSGESLGGWVAAWMAAHHPERVDRLVLNTPGNITAKPDVMARIRELSLRAVREASPATIRERLEFLMHDKAQVTEELVQVRLAIYTQPGFLKAMENILVLQDPEVRQRYTWGPEWCARIRAKTLILWTDHDPTGTLEEGRLLQTWIPGSQLRVIHGAGHWPQWEKPEEFNRLHEEFLLGDNHGSENR